MASHQVSKSAESLLKITCQPPEVFANQQYGKRAGFPIAVRLKNSINGVNLTATLVYAETLKPAIKNKFRFNKKQKVLLEVLNLDDFDTKGHAKMFCRINDVSRNHRGQLFRICLKCKQGDNVIDLVHTTPIKVISKAPKTKVKRKRKRRSGCGSEVARKKSADNNSDWSQRAFNFLKTIQHQQVGFYDAAHTKPILQCSACLRRNSLNSACPEHTEKCPLAGLINDFSANNFPPNNNITTTFSTTTNVATTTQVTAPQPMTEVTAPQPMTEVTAPQPITEVPQPMTEVTADTTAAVGMMDEEFEITDEEEDELFFTDLTRTNSSPDSIMANHTEMNSDMDKMTEEEGGKWFDLFMETPIEELEGWEMV